MSAAVAPTAASAATAPKRSAFAPLVIEFDVRICSPVLCKIPIGKFYPAGHVCREVGRAETLGRLGREGGGGLRDADVLLSHEAKTYTGELRCSTGRRRRLLLAAYRDLRGRAVPTPTRTCGSLTFAQRMHLRIVDAIRACESVWVATRCLDYAA